MAEVIAVGFHGAEGYAAKAMDFQDVLYTRARGDDEDIGFFTRADLVADRVDGRVLLVGVEGEVVEAAVGEAVSII